MTANATQESVRAIMRRKQKQEELNILTFCTHERYEQQLCKTGHQFYSISNTGKEWDTDYGKMPDNYHPITEFPTHVDFDLILCHTACQRLEISFNMRKEFNIPVLLHTHVLPDVRTDVEQQVKDFGTVARLADVRSFISEYNMKEWGFSKEDADVVEHGLDFEFWSDHPEEERHDLCLSVVNDWSNRDWCCGWELWKRTIKDLPAGVVGKNPGLSTPAHSLEHLRTIYHTASIFYNTSLHSPVPTVLMEAMACGCAVVSTANCMIPEVIQHGKNGLISNDETELRQYLEKLLSEPELARELGFNDQRTIAEKYNLSRFVDGWNHLFYSTINKYRG